MRRYFTRSLFLAAAALGLISGCSHCCRRPACATAAAPIVQAPPPGVLVPAPQGEVFNPPAPAAPANPVPDTRYSPLPPAPPESPTWQPGDAGVRLRAPEPVISAKPGDTLRIRPPEITEKVEPLPARPPKIEEGKRPAERAAPEARDGKRPFELPVGIPQFAPARDRVDAGLRPGLDGGLDWLQKNGYHTVLHVRRPGEDDATDRKEVEKRGMKYLSLEVSSQTLTKQTVEAFNRIVGDAAGHPLFVYDRDGSLAGGLWYLHFRTADGLADETARGRAAALGLREDRDGQRELWDAIRQVLGQFKPAQP